MVENCSLERYTVAELKVKALSKGIVITNKDKKPMKKEEIIAAIRSKNLSSNTKITPTSSEKNKLVKPKISIKTKVIKEIIHKPIIKFDGETSWSITSDPTISVDPRNMQRTVVKLPNGVKSIEIELSSMRYSDEMPWVIVLKCPHEILTLGQMFIAIYNAYKLAMTQKEVKDRLGLDEINDTEWKSALAKIKKGGLVYRHELMGDLVFYEGISLKENNIVLHLGS